MKRRTLFSYFIGVILFALPIFSLASIGVGVGLGKMSLSEVRPGGVYALPPLPVLNTGDEPSDYGVSVEYLMGVSEIRPPAEWFSFDPLLFHLEPGKVQQVGTTLSIPLQAAPGDYFAYLEAHPVKKSVSGVASIGVAAASKLYFTVVPSSLFAALYFSAYSFMARHALAFDIFFGCIALLGIILFLKRFVSFSIKR